MVISSENQSPSLHSLLRSEDMALQQPGKGHTRVRAGRQRRIDDSSHRHGALRQQRLMAIFVHHSLAISTQELPEQFGMWM